jgi:glutathione-regulated potassium-efflux system ancillary protein KefF
MGICDAPLVEFALCYGMPSTAHPGANAYVLAAHPHWRASRVNARLREAARAAPRTQVQDLYSAYPDYLINVAQEQAALLAAQLLVLLHPIQWYSMPALQKLWLDEVLSYGWAYGKNGTALRGKDLWLVLTTGGPSDSYHPESYNRYHFDAFLPPYEQTAALCGMRFLPPLILHGAHDATEQAVAAHVKLFEERLGTYPAWTGAPMSALAPQVPESTRPKA